MLLAGMCWQDCKRSHQPYVTPEMCFTLLWRYRIPALQTLDFFFKVQRAVSEFDQVFVGKIVRGYTNILHSRDVLYTSQTSSQEPAKQVTADQAIYKIAIDIQLQKTDVFDHLVLRMDGFHIVMHFLAVIRKIVEGWGLAELL